MHVSIVIIISIVSKYPNKWQAIAILFISQQAWLSEERLLVENRIRYLVPVSASGLPDQG